MPKKLLICNKNLKEDFNEKINYLFFFSFSLVLALAFIGCQKNSPTAAVVVTATPTITNTANMTQTIAAVLSKPFWDAYGAEIVQIHASGHADEQTLQRLVKAVKPGIIVPIHTQKPKLYEKVFAEQKIKICRDGEEIEI